MQNWTKEPTPFAIPPIANSTILWGAAAALAVGFFVADYVQEDVTTGSQNELFTASKLKTPKNFKVPIDRQFDTITTADGNTHINDSEAMIFEYIANKVSASDSGTITLFSEIPICESCSSVIQQFEKDFPKITVYLNSGPKR